MAARHRSQSLLAQLPSRQLDCATDLAVRAPLGHSDVEELLGSFDVNERHDATATFG